MATIDLDRVWKVIADLVENGNREDAEVVKNLKDGYLKTRAIIFAYSRLRQCLPGEIDANDIEHNFMSAPADEEAREIFIRWDLNLRKDKEYGIERGSAVESHWARFLLDDGPVTLDMVEHAKTADPEGWKRAGYELEFEGEG